MKTFRWTLTLLLAACQSFPERDFRENPHHDFDGDGLTEIDGDCDDGQVSAYPNAPEVCDNIDNDCDGNIDESAVDAPSWFADEDHDGYGINAYVIISCVQPEGRVAEGGDCDDTIAAIHPGAQEVCNGVDDDCDDLIDHSDPSSSGVGVWYLDADDDGHGDPAVSLQQCEQPANYVLDGDDCDDHEPRSYPGRQEVCDQVDNDCDTLVDDEDPDQDGEATWYADNDGDAFGNPASTTTACSAPSGYVADATDCNDNDGFTYPDADEACDEADNDCDDAIDEGVQLMFYADFDQDGFGDPDNTTLACDAPFEYAETSGDCDDTDPEVNEAPTWYRDVDADGFGNVNVAISSCTAPNGYVADDSDCDDARLGVHPAAQERCSTAYDDNCNGSTNDLASIGCRPYWADGDGDGFGTGSSQCYCDPSGAFTAVQASDCNDGVPEINPDAQEDCFTADDDNCDNDLNDVNASGCTIFYFDEDGDGYGTSATECLCEGYGYNTAETSGDCDDTEAANSPEGIEVCDGADNNCDSETDEGYALDADLWYRDSDGDGYGSLTQTKSACTQPTGYVATTGDCDDGKSGVHPNATETCSTAYDDNCSGTANDLNASGCLVWYNDTDADGYGTSVNECRCAASSTFTATVAGDCTDTDANISPGDPETCATAYDDDCDSTANETNAVACTNFYYDVDGDAYGTSTSVCQCLPTGYYTATAPGDCNDASPGTNPGALNCGLMGNVPLSSANATLPNAFGAARILSLGDHNGDGLGDLVATQPNDNTNGSNSGAAFIFSGPMSGSLGTGGASAVVRGGQFGAYLGYAVGAAGDVDNDGFGDLLLRSGGTSGSEQVYLFSGPFGATISENDAAASIAFPNVTSIEGVGDTNGDDFDDVVLLSTTGNALVYFGPMTGSGSHTSPGATLLAGTYTGSYGRGIAGGDFTGDGLSDVVIGQSDKALLFPAPYAGSVSAVNALSIDKDESNGASSWLPYTVVSSAGDTNGDGYEDLVLSDPGASVSESLGGATYVLFGPITQDVATSTADAKIYGDSSNEFCGFTASGAGDVNADGLDDLLVGSAGRALLFYGSYAGTQRCRDADATFSGSGDWWVNALGDTNNDGFGDVLLMRAGTDSWTSTGPAYLFYGAANY